MPFVCCYRGENSLLAEQIHEAFTRNMLAIYESDPDLTPLPQVEAIFLQLRQRGIKIALNTGFTRPVTNAILQRLAMECARNNRYGGVQR